MLIDFSGGSHLCYCTNIHPGETWSEILTNLKTYTLRVKEEVSPHSPFGIGLRISQEACTELLQDPQKVRDFKDFCTEHGLYVFTINGFIYGKFHGTRVKENVYLPDWRQHERLNFSNDIAELMVQLLPDDMEEGSVSTAPGAFKENAQKAEQVEQIVENLLLHMKKLYELKQQTGKSVVLALEPEPSCYIETIAETLAFFNDYMFHKNSIARLRDLIGHTMGFCEEFLRHHLGICYDTCHMALEYENAEDACEALENHGIRIAKVQISSAPCIEFSDISQVLPQLCKFQEDTYLHQVIERHNGEITRYSDMPLALAAAKTAITQSLREWRIHFHVPIFLDQLPDYINTTQSHIVDVLRHLQKRHLCHHYEVETYTWNVLPAEYRNVELQQAIVRELQWVQNTIKEL